jgi:hypothetical protein
MAHCKVYKSTNAMTARYIKLNDGGLQSCLNTTFTQDRKGKMQALYIDMKAFITNFHKNLDIIKRTMTMRGMQNENAKT